MADRVGRPCPAGGDHPLGRGGIEAARDRVLDQRTVRLREEGPDHEGICVARTGGGDDPDGTGLPGDGRGPEGRHRLRVREEDPQPTGSVVDPACLLDGGGAGAEDLGGVREVLGGGRTLPERRRGGEGEVVTGVGDLHRTDTALLHDGPVHPRDTAGVHPRRSRAQRGVPGEGQFGAPAEDADPVVDAGFGRGQHEGALREVRPRGDRPHAVRVQPFRPQDHGEGIAGVRRRREHVELQEGEAHPAIVPVRWARGNPEPGFGAAVSAHGLGLQVDCLR